MTQLQPFFRVVPALLFVYGIVIVFANVADLRNSASVSGMQGSMLTETRVTYVVGMIRCFYDLPYLWGLAALVTAANKYVETRVGSDRAEGVG